MDNIYIVYKEELSKQDIVRKILPQLCIHLRKGMKEISYNIEKKTISSKMSIYEMQNIFDVSLELLTTYWAVLETYNKNIKKKENKNCDLSLICSETAIDNIIKIYNNSNIDLITGEILSLPPLMTIIITNSKNKKYKDFYEIITRCKDILLIKF